MGFASFTSTQPKTIMVTDRAVEKGHEYKLS